MVTPVFDYAGLCERVAGRTDVVDELVQMLLASYPEQRRELEEHVRSGDAPGLREAAHRLKGQLRTLGVNRVAEEAQRIELLARDGRLDDARALLDALDSEMRRFAAVAMQTSGRAGSEPRTAAQAD